MVVILGLLAWLGLVVGVCIFPYRRVLWGIWREPVLTCPVLIIESDDWGAGPLTQTTALTRIAERLRKFRDSDGQHPVMTLGLVLALPDFSRLREMASASDQLTYYRQTLAMPRYESLCQTIKQGQSEQVFFLQLHGMEHYWPPALLAASRSNRAVKQWLYAGQDHCTESLPSALQSRWVHASSLPSRAITVAEIEAAVAEEVSVFAEIFNQAPHIVVPPTFVWTEAVERAWVAQGVDIIVTPGQRHVGRDSTGGMVSDQLNLFNTQKSASGAGYMVRNDYFEPTLGHEIDTTLMAIQHKHELGRPTLLETHRFNFLGEQADDALDKLSTLLEQTLQRFPTVRFMSTEQLYTRMLSRNDAIVEAKFKVRLAMYLKRITLLSGFWRRAKFTGLAFIMKPLQWVAG